MFLQLSCLIVSITVSRQRPTRRKEANDHSAVYVAHVAKFLINLQTTSVPSSFCIENLWEFLADGKGNFCVVSNSQN